MMPYPIICLPKLADHEPLVRGLYRMGYRFYPRDLTEDETWAAWGRSCTSHLCPYIHNHHSMSASMSISNHPDKTPVNSVAHFLSYARRLNAPPQPS